jgi:hypothetical protein
MTTSEATAPSLPPEVAATQLLFHIGTGYMASAALQTVLKLGIADHMSAGPTSVADLARKTSVNEDALYRVMRTLASLGIFDEVSPHTFALTLAGRMLQKKDSSFYNMGLWITSPFHFRVYANMLHSVTTGKPGADKVTGMPLFEYFAQPENRELSEIFNNAMTGFSAQVGPAAVEAYDFSGIGTLVDVAGGHGMLLTSILQKYPGMRGILFDLPHVIEGARPVIEAAGVKDRCTTQSGDFFKEVPDGDAYIMKHIIHDWDDERAAQILRTIRPHLSGEPAGRVILLEAVLQPGNQPDLGKMIDLEMLMMPGGKERSEAEFATLFKSAGYALTRVVPTKSPLSIIEAKVA